MVQGNWLNHTIQIIHTCTIWCIQPNTYTPSLQQSIATFLNTHQSVITNMLVLVDVKLRCICKSISRCIHRSRLLSESAPRRGNEKFVYATLASVECTEQSPP